MGQLPQQVQDFLLTGQVFSWINISSWKYIVQWVCQVMTVMLISIITYRGNKRQDFFFFSSSPESSRLNVIWE